MGIVLALMVGSWSLLAQFVFNRVIFFYVANSEYTAAIIITLHLTGFWLGAAIARRTMLPLLGLVVGSLGTMLAAEILVWRLGVMVLGLPATIVLAAFSGLLLATLSGAIVVRLMQLAGKANAGQGILVADTLGSVFGALVGGFILLPVFGIRISFMGVIGLQAVALALVLWSAKRRNAGVASTLGGVALLVALWFAPTAVDMNPDKVVASEGMVLHVKEDRKMDLLFSERSPYGTVSVTRFDDTKYMLSINGRDLCYGGKNDLDLSTWETGAWPVARLDPAFHKGYVANIGLGCGMTMAGMLEGLPDNGHLDVIEINPVMPKAQKQFNAVLPYSADDPRLNIIIQDGFRYFAERTPGNGVEKYDAVAIDLAWMQNMNITHLFSREMYQNVRRNLHPEGVLTVWSEETNPLSPVSQIVFATLSEVFPNVVMQMVDGIVLFHASENRSDLNNFLTESDRDVSAWLREAVETIPVPVNRLDNLVMNRFKFTPWGDSTWERLYDKYGEI